MPLHGYIIVEKNTGQDGSAFPMTMERCLIGRGSTCDIRIKNQDVAEEQCVIKSPNNGPIYIESLSANHVTTLKGQRIGNSEKVLSHGDVFCVGERSFRWEYLTNSPFYKCPAKDIDSLTNLARAPFYNNSTSSNKNKKGKKRLSSFQIINTNNFSEVNMKESPSKRLVAIVTPQRRSCVNDSTSTSPPSATMDSTSALQAFASVNRKGRTSTLKVDENTYQEKSLLNLSPPPMELTVATVIVATTPKQNLPTASTPQSRKKRFSKVSSNNENKTSSPLLHDLKETATTVSSQELKTFSSINSVETSKTLLSVSMKNTPLSVSKTSVLRKSHLLTPEDNLSKISTPARQKKRLSVVSSKILKKTPSAKTSRISKGMTPSPNTKASPLSVSSVLIPKESSPTVSARASSKKKLLVVSSKIRNRNSSSKTPQFSKGEKIPQVFVDKTTPSSMPHMLTTEEGSPTLLTSRSCKKRPSFASSKIVKTNSSSKRAHISKEKTPQFSVDKITSSSTPRVLTTKKGSPTLTPASCKERPSFVSSKIVKSNSSSKTLRISKGKSLSPVTRSAPLITPLVCTPNKISTLSTPVSRRKNVLIVSSKMSPLSKSKIQPVLNLELQSEASNMQTPSRTKKMLTKLEASPSSVVSSEPGVISQRSTVTIVPSPKEMLKTSALVINSSTGKKKSPLVMKASSAVSRTRRSLLKAKTPLSEVKSRQVSSNKQSRPKGNMSLLKKLNNNIPAPKSINKKTFITGRVSRIPVLPHSALKTRSVLKLKDVGLQSAERAATRLKTMVSTKSPDKKKMAALMVCHVKSSSKQGKNLQTAKESIVSSLEKKYFNRNLEMNIKTSPSAPFCDESSASSSGWSIVEFDSHDIVLSSLSDKRVECKQSTPVRMNASNSDLQTLDAVFLDDQDTSLILSPTKSSHTSRILTSETGHSKVSPAKTPVKRSRKSSFTSRLAESVSTVEKSPVRESRKLSRKSKDYLPRKEISPIESSIMSSKSPQNLSYGVSPAKSQNISRKSSRNSYAFEVTPLKSPNTSRKLSQNSSPFEISPVKSINISRKSSRNSSPLELSSVKSPNTSRKSSRNSSPLELSPVKNITISKKSFQNSPSFELSPVKSPNTSRKSSRTSSPFELSPVKSINISRKSSRNSSPLELSPVKSINISRKSSRNSSPLELSPVKSINISRKSSRNSSPLELSPVKNINISRKSPRNSSPLELSPVKSPNTSRKSPTTSLDKSRTSSLTSQSFEDESLVNSPSKNKKTKKSSLKTQTYKDTLPAESPIRKSIKSSSKSCLSEKVSGVVKSTARKSSSELQSPEVPPEKIPLGKYARSSCIVQANDELSPTDVLVNEESVKPHRLSARASLGVSDTYITESPSNRLRMSTRKSEALFATSSNEVRSSGVSQMGEISLANTPIDKRWPSYKEPSHKSLSPEQSSCTDLPAGKLNTPLTVQSLSPMPSSILKSGKGKRRTLASPVVRFISSIEKQDDACLESELPSHLLSIEEDEALTTQSYYSPSDSIISMSSHKKKSSIAPEESGGFGSKKRKLSWKDEVLNSSSKKTRYSIKTNESAVSPLSNSSFDFGDFKTPCVSLRKIVSPLSAVNSSKSNKKSLILADSSDIQISSTDDGDGSQQSFNSMPSLNFSASSFDANATSFNFDAVKTPTVPTEVFVSSFSNSSFSSTNSVRAIRKRPSLPRYLTDLQSAEEILDTSPKSDLSILMGVRGIHKLIKSPSTPESPQNDLTNVRDTRNLRKTRKTPKSPLNDLTDVRGVRKLMKTPTTPKSPLNDLTDVRGVRTLMKTPKTPKSPLNDLTDVRGVRKLMKTPTTPKSPLNDLTDVRGVRKLMKTPTTPKSPLNDLTDVRGVRKLMKTPTTPKSPLNDLTDVRGVRKLMKTPTTPKSPLNDLTDVRGVRKLMKTPKTPKSPLNDLTDVRGVRTLMKTPKTPKSPLNDLTDVTAVERLMKMPRTSKSPLNDQTDSPGSKNVFQTSKSPFTSYINVERLDLLFASSSTSAIEITEPDAIDPKVAFLKKVDLVEGTGTPSPKRATRTRRAAVVSEDNSDLPTPTKRSRRLAIKIEQSVVTPDIPKQRNMLVVTKNVVLPTDESLPQGAKESKPQKKGKSSRKNMPAAASKTKEEIKLELPLPVKDLIDREVLPRRRGHLANTSDSLPNESSSGTTQIPKQTKKSQRGKLTRGNDQESTFKYKEDTKDLPSTSADKNGSESVFPPTLYPAKDSKKLQKLNHEPKVDNSIEISAGTIISFTETANTPQTRRGKKALDRQRETDAAVDKSENVKQPPIKTRSLRSKVSKDENSAGSQEKIEKQNKALLETKVTIIETSIKSEELHEITHEKKKRVHLVTDSSEGSLPARSTRRGRLPKQNPTDNTSSRRNSPDNSVDADENPTLPKRSRRAKNSSDSEERLKEQPKPKGQLEKATNSKKTTVVERGRKKAEVSLVNEEPTNSRSRRRAAQPKAKTPSPVKVLSPMKTRSRRANK